MKRNVEEGRRVGGGGGGKRKHYMTVPALMELAGLISFRTV